jgi:hypothetical protein
MWGRQNFSGCTCLKRLFYKNQVLSFESRDESLTLSDLKKTKVLKLA